jgi:hypothetical protein
MKLGANDISKIYLGDNEVSNIYFVDVEVYSSSDVPWTPAQITTSLWLDASDESTIVNGVGDNVAEWKDKSGNGNDAVQTVSGDQPSVGVNTLGGLDVITFDEDYFNLTSQITDVRSDLFVTNNLNGSTNLINISIILGDKEPVLGTDYTLIQVNVEDSQYDISLDGTLNRLGSASVNGGNIVSGTNINLGQTNAQNKSENIWYAEYDVNTSASKIFGTTSQGTVLFSRGDLAEIVLLNYVPTTETRQNLEGYLAHKWGLTSKLPVDHPYKNNKPLV